MVAPLRRKQAGAKPQAFFGLFLLPGGLPRRFTSVIQAGGRPRRLPRPAARRSSVMIACSRFSRSARSSASILVMSILAGYRDCDGRSLHYLRLRSSRLSFVEHVKKHRHGHGSKRLD
jgi:hypothetical protein